MSTRHSFLLVSAITLAGACLRIWRLGYGLPQVWYVDEGLVTYFALNMGSGDLNPHHFLHPNLYYYMMFFGDVAFILFGYLTGIFEKLADAWRLYKTDPTIYFLIARWISAVLGTLSIPFTYLIGKKLWSNKRIGVIAASFLALSFLHIQWSQIGYMDIPLTFFIIVSFYAALQALSPGKTKYFLLAGFLGGLASSTKYQGFPTFLWGPLAACLVAWEREGRLFNHFVWKQTCLFGLLFLLGFSLGTPYWILDFPSFKAHILTNFSWYRPDGQGELGFDGRWNWWYYLSTPLRYGLGLPLEIASIVGMLWILIQRKRENIFFAIFPLAYFLIAGSAWIHKPSYILPLVPFLTLSAAYAVVGIATKWLRLQEGKALGALALATILLATPPLLSSLRYSYLRNFQDTRQSAMEWIDAHVPPDEKVLTSFFSMIDYREPRLERFDRTVFDLRFKNRSSLKTIGQYRRLGYHYLVLDQWHRDTILVEGTRHPKYAEIVRKYKTFIKELKQEAKLVMFFTPYKNRRFAFDLENVQIPSRDLWRLTRPGPAIWIYKL